jgi:hypothetical protein
VVKSLSVTGKLAGLLSISSGAVNFDDSCIRSEWHLAYKRIKVENELFYRSLSDRYFHPKVFAVIGEFSYAAQRSAWANILMDCAIKDSVLVGLPDERRSWIDESLLCKKIYDVFRNDCFPRDNNHDMVCGDFCLREVIAVCSEFYGKEILLQPTVVDGWLNCPYLSRREFEDQINISSVILRLLRNSLKLSS